MQWFVDLCLQPGGYWVAVVLLTLVGCSTLISIVALIQWRKVRQAEQQALLVQDLLERGMSTEEILQILAAVQGFGTQPRLPSRGRLEKAVGYTG